MFDTFASLLVFDLAGWMSDTPLGAALHFFVMAVLFVFVDSALHRLRRGWHPARRGDRRQGGACGRVPDRKKVEGWL